MSVTVSASENEKVSFFICHRALGNKSKHPVSVTGSGSENELVSFIFVTDHLKTNKHPVSVIGSGSGN